MRNLILECFGWYRHPVVRNGFMRLVHIDYSLIGAEDEFGRK
jgi:hypothetical protein